MSTFAVTREAGPTWVDGKGVFDQPEVNDHATFMSALADQGVVHVAGPLSGSEQGRIRALVVMEATSEADVHRLLGDDPWVVARRIVTTSVEPWVLLVGGERFGLTDP